MNIPSDISWLSATATHTSWLAVLAAGIGVGFIQSFKFEHVAAIVPMMAKARPATRSALIGFWYGLGHWLMWAILLFAVLGLHWRLGLEAEMMLHFASGVMLVSLGLNLLLQKLLAKDKTQLALASVTQPKGLAHGWRPFLLGGIQGMAGASTWLFALEQLSGTWPKSVFIASFAVGSIGGITLLALMLGFPASWSVQRSPKLFRFLPYLYGAYTVGLGLWLCYFYGWVKGLFVNWY